ncbi:hypothetical protein JVU11DRAFT_11968 [Chiua virens]|nr:hypothetical protein JVU11DRAFT_11968 [Chiua virens]
MEVDDWEEEGSEVEDTASLKKSKNKGKQSEKRTQKARKHSKSKADTGKKKDLEQMIEQIHLDLKDATLGYALMTFLDDNDLGQGPTMVKQTINPRKIDLKYCKNFSRSIKNKGLQNRKVENAIVVGVKKGWLKTSSLTGMHEGIYTNQVEWNKSKFGEEDNSVLFNGNHRLNYMTTEHASRHFHHKYQHAAKWLRKPSLTTEERKRYEKMLKDMKEKIDKEGVWLVRFINMDSIEKCEDPFMLNHHLASNAPLANLEDTEDVKVSQVLLMMASMPLEQRRKHAQSLCAQLGARASLYKLLKDEGLYTSALKLLGWKHFHGTKAGAGLTARHLLSWNPVFGGMMQKFADHMADVLRFLSLPMDLRSVAAVAEEAKAHNIDPKVLQKEYAKVMCKEADEMSIEAMECDFVDKWYLDTWAADFVALLATPSVFEKFGSDHNTDKEEYDTAMKTYWFRVKSHCVEMVEKPPSNIDEEQKKIVDRMEAKVTWLCTGYVLDTAPQWTCTLPLPNKYLLPDILKLYKNEKINLETVVMDLVISVEPMAKVVIEQRDVKTTKKDSEEVLSRPWTNYTSALFHTVKLDDKAVNKLWSLLVKYRRSHLLPISHWIKEFGLKLGDKKLQKSEEAKLLVPHVTQQVKTYKEKMMHHRMIEKVSYRPKPEVPAKLNDDLHTEYMEHFSRMLYVTSLPWEEKNAIKKVETLIKHTWPFVLCIEQEREPVLATKEGWALRETLGKIVGSSAFITGQNTMVWWDNITERPDKHTVAKRIDHGSIILQAIDGESRGNQVARIEHIDETRKRNTQSVQKVVELVLVKHLGLLKEGLMSDKIAKPLHALCDAMMIESEKHLARLENPKLNTSKLVFNLERMAEMKLEYMPEKALPKTVSIDEEISFWEPITDAEQLKPMTHMKMTTFKDVKLMIEDENDTKARMKVADKVMKEKDKVVMYDRKTRQKMREQMESDSSSDSEAANLDSDSNSVEMTTRMVRNELNRKHKEVAAKRAAAKKRRSPAKNDMREPAKVVADSSDNETEERMDVEMADGTEEQATINKGKSSQPLAGSSKRPISEVERDLEEDEENASRAQRSRLNKPKDNATGSASAAEEATGDEYTWMKFRSNFEMKSWPSDMNGIPIMLRILEDVINVVEDEKDPMAFEETIKEVGSWETEPHSIDVLSMIERLAALYTLDGKYMEAANNWTRTHHGMRGVGNDDEVYGKTPKLLIMMDAQFGPCITGSHD